MLDKAWVGCAGNGGRDQPWSQPRVGDKTEISREGAATGGSGDLTSGGVVAPTLSVNLLGRETQQGGGTQAHRPLSLVKRRLPDLHFVFKIL